MSRGEREAIAGFPGVGPQMVDRLTEAGLYTPARIVRGGLEALEAVSLHTSHKHMRPELVRELHARGYKVMLYTVNEIAAAQRWFDAGADGLFTDNLREFAERFPKLI